MSASEASSLVGRRLGRFRILSRIGQGGLATVWRAHDELLGRDVALKVLNETVGQSPKIRKRFVHEAQAASLLDHPGIVTLFDAGESDGLAYMALTLVDGETVSEWASQRLMPVADAVRITMAAADALAHAHAHGVIHRDVSGRNVMVAKDGRVYVLDFGLALAVGLSRVTTSPGTTLGTIAYMSPEALRGSNLDPRADVYGLGVVLFEALTGAYPHAGDRVEQISHAKLNGILRCASELRPDVPIELDLVIGRALARDPAERYPDMSSMREDLAKLCSDLASPPAPYGGIAPTVAPARSMDPGAHDELRATRPDPAYLVLLPFSVTGSASQDDAVHALASRLADTLAAAVGSAKGIRVVPVSPTERERYATEEGQVWARRVGANLVVCGEVARVAPRIRVTYTVRDPWRGVQIAGGVIDGSDTHPFDLEDDVVASLRIDLGIEDHVARDVIARPQDPAASDKYQLAQRYLMRHDHEASIDGAIRILQALADSRDARPDHVATLGRAYLTKWRLTQERAWEMRAASSYARAAALAPDHPQVILLGGLIDEAAGRTEVARERFRETLSRDPECLDARLGLVRVLSKEGRWEEAEALCTAITRDVPEDWRAFNRLGGIRFRRGDYQASVEPFRRVIELVPGSAHGHRNIGSALYHLDQFEAAIEAYQRALEIEPEPIAFSNLGTAFFHQGRYSEAMAMFERAIAMRPGEADLWGNLGNACRWIPEQETRMREALDRAVALMRDRLDGHPADAEGRARMAGWLINLGCRTEALAQIQAVLERAPDDVRCLVRAGYVYADAGDHPAAIRWFREAVERGYGTHELERSPVLAELRMDPEFQRILEESRNPRSDRIADRHS